MYKRMSRFQIACKEIPSPVRKNVCKFLIRDVIKDVDIHPSKYLLHYGDKLLPNQLDQVREICLRIKAADKNRAPGVVRKDYVNVIDMMLPNPYFNAVLQLRLGEILNEYPQGKFKRVCEHNKEDYFETLVNLYVYSKELMETYNQATTQMAPFTTQMAPLLEPNSASVTQIEVEEEASQSSSSP